MCKFLSDSIMLGAVAAPAEVPSYRGLLALVQYNMDGYYGDLTSIVNPALNKLGYKELEHSVIFDTISHEDALISRSAIIRLPEIDENDPLLNLVVTLLGYEKHYTKCYLSKANRTTSVQEFVKILNIVIEGILLRLESLAGKVGILSDGIIDILCMHYLTMIMEISLLWHIKLFKELYPVLIPVFSRQTISSNWIEESLHSYKIIDCCNSVKKFIQERYAFSLQKVSEDNHDVISGTLKTSVEEALVLYRNLSKLLLESDSPLMHSEIYTCMAIIENYLYFTYSEHSIPAGNWINIFSDKRICMSIATNLEKNHYSPRILSQRTARGAYENIHSFLKNECFNFLNDCNNICSIPRLLREYLISRQVMYASIYDKILDPVYKEKDGTITENLYLKYSVERCNNILSEIDNLNKGNSSEYILEESELKKLKTYFSEFCKLGYAKTLSYDDKVKVNKNKLYCLHGFFCDVIGITDNGTTDCYNLLKETIRDFNRKTESNFKKGRAAFINAYKEHKEANIIPYL